MVKSQAILEGILQDGSVTYTIIELSEICVVTVPLIEEMREHGIIEPKTPQAPEQFDYRALFRAQKALRLQHDLAINWEGISVVLDLLEEIDELHQRLKHHER